MKAAHQKYEQFSNWIKEDIRNDHFHVNRKVFSVVFWCLIFPSAILFILHLLRKYGWIDSFGYADLLIYLPPFIFTLYSIWPTIRDTPKTFKKGGVTSLLEESSREVEWREKTVSRITEDLKLTPKEWSMVAFHLRAEIARMKQQNWYITILAGVVLFFMFQFLDLGSANEVLISNSPVNQMKFWIDQFSQWSVQVFSLGLFSTLFYLSGLQFQRQLERYLICVERILIEEL
jgi:hypothetical protein